MGLSEDDKLPKGISLEEAYRLIRTWYRDNVRIMKDRSGSGASESVRLIMALPSVKSVTELEIRAVLYEVIWGYLECGYHQSDGNYKMAAYAHAALEAHQLGGGFSDEDALTLSESRLWPFLIERRRRRQTTDS